MWQTMYSLKCVQYGGPQCSDSSMFNKVHFKLFSKTLYELLVSAVYLSILHKAWNLNVSSGIMIKTAAKMSIAADLCQCNKKLVGHQRFVEGLHLGTPCCSTRSDGYPPSSKINGELFCSVISCDSALKL